MAPRTRPRPPTDAEVPRHRSGAVARMVRMPVATLRVWERRYAVAQPALSPSGQRLYSAADVQRLALLKRLSDLGHAIGGLAGLDMAQLQAVAATHAGGLPAPRPQPSAAHGKRQAASSRAWHLVVVGAALAARLQRPAVVRAWQMGLTGQVGRQSLRLSGPYADVAQAAAAVGRKAVDALLVHEPRLHDGWLDQCDAAAPAFAAVPKAVLYRFASDAVCERLALAGVQLLREPQADAVIGQWLRGLARPAPAAQAAATAPPPRRFDDTVLADIAGLSSTVACECPRHVAELLMQLSHFEAYSADCALRSPADAALHAHLQQVAAASRALFEGALERVALHEGLLLPA